MRNGKIGKGQMVVTSMPVFIDMRTSAFRAASEAMECYINILSDNDMRVSETNGEHSRYYAAGMAHKEVGELLDMLFHETIDTLTFMRSLFAGADMGAKDSVHRKVFADYVMRAQAHTAFQFEDGLELAVIWDMSAWREV